MMVQHPQKQVKQVADSSMWRSAGLKTHQKKGDSWKRWEVVVGWRRGVSERSPEQVVAWIE